MASHSVVDTYPWKPGRVQKWLKRIEEPLEDGAIQPPAGEAA